MDRLETVTRLACEAIARINGNVAVSGKIQAHVVVAASNWSPASHVLRQSFASAAYDPDVCQGEHRGACGPTDAGHEIF